jgi:dTDP-4-amino-4,6-dideoxygalactose transaminase
LALGLGVGDKAITTPITFAASSNAILYTGADVVFSDIDGDSFLLDLELLEEKIKNDSSIKGIIPVHYAGLAINSEDLHKLCKKYDLWIVEDACHAPGAHNVDSKGNTYRIGSNQYSDLTVFSFHPVKHIATGEGGMITTNDEKLYKKLKQLRSHGITKDKGEFIKTDAPPWHQEMHHLGYNYRMSDINATLGVSQLAKLDQSIKRRNEIANKYTSRLSALTLKVQQNKGGYLNAFHLFVITTDKRDELHKFLAQNKVYGQVHYPPVFQHPYYQNKYPGVDWNCPNSEHFYNTALSLPMYPTLTDAEVDGICDLIEQFFNL